MVGQRRCTVEADQRDLVKRRSWYRRACLRRLDRLLEIAEIGYVRLDLRRARAQPHLQITFGVGEEGHGVLIAGPQLCGDAVTRASSSSVTSTVRARDLGSRCVTVVSACAS